MHGLTERDLVPLWEAGDGRGPLERASLLLASALPDLGPEELDDLTLGQREATLLSLRGRTFGRRLEGFVRCPECDEPLELALGEDELRAIESAEPDLSEHDLDVGEYVLRFRPLTCRDVREAASGFPPVEEVRARLLERAVQSAEHDGAPVGARDLPAEVTAVLAGRLAESDPQAELGLNVECPECEAAWRATLDVGAFLWAEVSGEARRLLEEVHVLARAYGWREDEILELSARRRRFYLELAG